ncbi:proliferating cell nuclear antigen [Colletotrichum sojae]|uniref:Vezatin n=1 Tax=Colletotrichum sojae TaxID=2175907 RepID=A0A8H6IVC5_9PEZI|nr:proliferating cell nuclear antigen [Colletotrichum sojae]
MEPVVFDQSPLAEYLRDEGEDEQAGWAHEDPTYDVSPPSSPEFAPTGRPMVRSRFRNNPLQINIPTKSSSDNSYRRSYSTAVASRIDRADNSKFLEQFRYTIIASQLLSGHSILSQHHASPRPAHGGMDSNTTERLLDSTGAVVAVLGALALAVSINWLAGSGPLNKRRFTLILLVALIAAGIAHVYMRRQWLRYRRLQALSEVTAFVSNSQEFDGATGAAIALVQEVELVSRGYRLSAPLPPISRIEDRSQTRKCVRLRKALRACFADVIPAYHQTMLVVKGFSEQLDLEKYYDIYDISDFDMSDAKQGYQENEFDDTESLRTLKILAARFHTIRKMFLCALLALDASGDSNDLLRWTTIVEAVRTLNTATQTAFERLRRLLSEEESFPAPPTPKMPLTPGRERWRSQLRKLNSLSSGIRGLQAKLQLLREESDRSLNESDDISELGINLLSQYESIGADLKILMQAWEEGKAALAQGIDRNEKRLSSMSTLLSPASSLSGLTTVEEGGAEAALKALNGESPSSLDFSSTGEPDTEEIFEAVAQPRPRSLFTREERIIKMREDREKREIAKEKADADRGMLKELEMVINLRPRPRTGTTPSRIVSM